MTEITDDLIEGPHFTVDTSQTPMSVACGACGGGTWLDPEYIPKWVGEHAAECMKDTLDDELPADEVSA